MGLCEIFVFCFCLESRVFTFEHVSQSLFNCVEYLFQREVIYGYLFSVPNPVVVASQMKKCSSCMVRVLCWGSLICFSALLFVKLHI